jgi:aspartate aminotransferase/aminotransferase
MLQQYTFVCAPHPLQWAALAALDVDMSEQMEAYRRKRDLVAAGLLEAGYSVARPGGAFYVFPEVPRSTGKASGTQESASQFVARCIENELLVIPGSIFSGRDTHFRISFAASEETIERGLAVLRHLTRAP